MLYDRNQKEYSHVNIHQVNGDKKAIEYLRGASDFFVEKLFWRAKEYGNATFDFNDEEYMITRNNNLSYTITFLEKKQY